VTEIKDDNLLHESVMATESISSLQLEPGLTVVDATVNRGGHAQIIAEAIGSKGTLIIFDLDKQALEFAKKRLEKIKSGPKIIAVHSNYRSLTNSLSANGIESVDRIFADLGLSSQELDISGRGFSFRYDEPLHMTYQSEITKDLFTAKDLVNNLSVSSLEKIFKVYGEERNAWKIANAIVEARSKLEEKKKSISTTKQLVEIIESVSPRKGKTHPATKVFQAIRIAVNDEYEGIKEFITSGWSHLKQGGIISIITFHSGEDRIVKRMFKEFETKENKQTKQKPDRPEVLKNRRSRSAILRTIKKI